MGFFSDLKEDLSQAVNELLPEENMPVEETPMENVPVETQEAKVEPEISDLDSVNLSDMLDKMEKEMGLVPETPASETTYVPEEPLDILGAADAILAGLGVETQTTSETEHVMAQDSVETVEASVEEVTPEPVAMEVTEQTLVPESDSKDEVTENDNLLGYMVGAGAELNVQEEAPVIEETAPVLEPVVTPSVEETITYKEEKDMMEEMKPVRKEATDETAVITAGMTIRGDVETEGSLELIGKVIGNIQILGKLSVTGNIEGNSGAAEIYAEKAHIVGELKSEGAVKIGQNSIIIGNIYGNSAVVAGAVKGDIDVKGPVILDSTAIVMGNIKSKSVQINNGAVIEGMCSQCYADVSPTSFFDELKNL